MHKSITTISLGVLTVISSGIMHYIDSGDGFHALSVLSLQSWPLRHEWNVPAGYLVIFVGLASLVKEIIEKRIKTTRKEIKNK